MSGFVFPPAMAPEPLLGMFQDLTLEALIKFFCDDVFPARLGHVIRYGLFDMDLIMSRGCPEAVGRDERAAGLLREPRGDRCGGSLRVEKIDPEAFIAGPLVDQDGDPVACPEFLKDASDRTVFGDRINGHDAAHRIDRLVEIRVLDVLDHDRPRPLREIGKE